MRELRMAYVLLLLLMLFMVASVTIGQIPSRNREKGAQWSHGCRGIPGLNQTVNTLRCPIGCTIAIHQVTYATKNRPGCPYEISHSVEPHCCQREATDDCYQDKRQKIPMLQLLCREASNVCELSVDRVAIRCPRNAYSISTMRSIRYSCLCASPPASTVLQTEVTVTTTAESVQDPLPHSTQEEHLNSSASQTSNTTWLSESYGKKTAVTQIPALSISSPFSRIPSIGPLNSATSLTTFSRLEKTHRSTTTTHPHANTRSVSTEPSIADATTLPSVETTSASTTTTTPWTLTAENHSTRIIPSSEKGSHDVQRASDDHQTAGNSVNGALLGGIIGGAAVIFAISTLAVVILCVKRKRRKCDAQEEASQYAYEIMDISLRRPQPIVTHVPEVTSCHDMEEAHDINLEGQSPQGSFLEKKIQRYLITSIYAEIKDFKRHSQESAGTVTQEKTVTVKPTPKPRKTCDLYARVNKRCGKTDPDGKVKRNSDRSQVGQQSLTCPHGIVPDASGDNNDRISSGGTEDIYSTCDDLANENVTGGACNAQMVTSTYDRLMSCDTKAPSQCDRAPDRAASGPYDELYTTKSHNVETLERVRYFDNCEYATLNVANGQALLSTSQRNSFSD